jgi:hypothetical protein
MVSAVSLIGRTQTASVKQLVDELGMTKDQAGGILEEMEAGGLLIRNGTRRRVIFADQEISQVLHGLGYSPSAPGSPGVSALFTDSEGNTWPTGHPDNDTPDTPTDDTPET